MKVVLRLSISPVRYWPKGKLEQLICHKVGMNVWKAREKTVIMEKRNSTLWLSLRGIMKKSGKILLGNYFEVCGKHFQFYCNTIICNFTF